MCGSMSVGNYTCTDVSSIPRIVSLESMYIVKRIMSLCIISLCGMVFILLSRQSPEQGKSFLPATVVFCESLFSAPIKLTRALNLSAFYHDHSIKLLNNLYFLTRRPGRREGFYFFVSFYAAHCSNHCLYFPIVSTEYGVDINIL